ncbi:MAG: hypothetical protein ACJ739_00650, partial [Acidimicrobiales bacterium]
MRTGSPSRRSAVVLAVLAVLASVAALGVAPATAATGIVTGTATTSGGDNTSTTEFTYTSSGVLGTGSIHNEFVLVFGQSPLRTEGTGVLTRSDGSTLTLDELGTVDLSRFPYPVEIHFVVTAGTGALAGASGEIVLTGTSTGPGAVGEAFSMTGGITLPSPIPSDRATCLHGGWRDVADDHGDPF